MSIEQNINEENTTKPVPKNAEFINSTFRLYNHF